MTPDVRALPFWSPAEIDAALAPAITQLRARRLIAYPTETVYGFGGGVDQESVDALAALKHRPVGKPFLLLIAGSDMLSRLNVRLTPAATVLAAHFWPGPLTLVLPGAERRVPDLLRGPEGGVAVRWTPHSGLLRLIRAYGDPITSTSANPPGSPPATSATVILREWRRELLSGQLLLLDGGTLVASPPSTVVDCMGPHPRVIRPGAVSAAALRVVVPELIGNA